MVCYQAMLAAFEPCIEIQRPRFPTWVDLGHLLQQIHMTINAHEIHWGHLAAGCFSTMPGYPPVTDSAGWKIHQISFSEIRGAFSPSSQSVVLVEMQWRPEFDKTVYYSKFLDRLTLLTLRVATFVLGDLVPLQTDETCDRFFGEYFLCKRNTRKHPENTCSHGALKPCSWLKFVTSN